KKTVKVAMALNMIDGDSVEHEKMLSFEKDLRHAYALLSERLEKGVVLLDELTTVLYLRIESDAELTRGLQKILHRMESQTDEIGTIKDALDAIKADIKNDHTCRTEYVNSLTEDVYKPLVELREHYVQNNKRVNKKKKKGFV
ncbi:hypothetical protein RFI_31937, partial [Reticulomyxa filosa]